MNNFKIVNIDEYGRVIVSVQTKFGHRDEKGNPKKNGGYDIWSLDIPATKLVGHKEVPMTEEDYKAAILAHIKQYESETEALQKDALQTPASLKNLVGKSF